MASRKVHNYVAKLLTGEKMTEIDRINKDVDEPYKYLGRYHRKLYHNHDPFSIDSLMITDGDPEKELIRQIHIYVDEHPEIGDLLEAYLILKKKRRR